MSKGVLNYAKEKICAWCGKKFIAHTCNAKYCCDECRKAAALEQERIAYAKEQARLLEMRKPKGSVLSQLAYAARMARDVEGSRMSYGQYVGINKL